LSFIAFDAFRSAMKAAGQARRAVSAESGGHLLQNRPTGVATVMRKYQPGVFKKNLP